MKDQSVSFLFRIFTLIFCTSVATSTLSFITATSAEARYCLSERITTAGGARTRAGAKYFARRHWRRSARLRRGRCFDSFTLSRGKRWNCRRDRPRHWRCVVSARPCSTCGTLYD